MDEVRLALKGLAGAPREARHALRDWLTTVSCPEQLRDDILLVVSELVTNAVVHARSDPIVVAMFDDGRLRIEVHDQASGSPPIVTSSAGPDGGFGIRLVAALSDAWGWTPTESGKRVDRDAVLTRVREGSVRRAVHAEHGQQPGDGQHPADDLRWPVQHEVAVMLGEADVRRDEHVAALRRSQGKRTPARSTTTSPS